MWSSMRILRGGVKTALKRFCMSDLVSVEGSERLSRNTGEYALRVWLACACGSVE